MLHSKRASIALIIAGIVLVSTALSAAQRNFRSVEPSLSTSAAIGVAGVRGLTSSPTAVPTVTMTAQPTATLARREFNDSMARKIAPTTFLPGSGPELPGAFVFSGRWLDFYVGSNTFAPEEVTDLALKSEVALRYVQRRFAVALRERVSVGVYSKALAPDSGTRGIAHTERDVIKIYYRPGEDLQSALVIVAHELAHHLQAEAYGADAQRRADLVLLEGLATWIAGEYWLHHVDAPSWQVRAHQLLEQGYGGNLRFAHRSGNYDVAYELWAAFVDYLAYAYGWEKLNALYVSGRGRSPGSADYEGIYGKSFAELEAEWKEWVRGDS